MRNAKKTIIRIALSCIVVGALMVGVGFALGGSLYNTVAIRGNIFRFNSWHVGGSESTNEDTTIALDSFHTLDMDIHHGDIEIKQGDRYALIVKNAPEESYTISQSDGVLNVHDEEEFTLTLNFGFNFNETNYKYTVLVPKEMKEITIETSMGDIDINDIEVDTLHVFQKMGEVSLQDMQVLKEMTVEQKMGDINFEGEWKGKADFLNKMGDIDLIIRGDEEAYQYDLSTSMGDIEVNGKDKGNGLNSTYSRGNGEHILSVDDKMGDISLEFR